MPSDKGQWFRAGTRKCYTSNAVSPSVPIYAMSGHSHRPLIGSENARQLLIVTELVSRIAHAAHSNVNEENVDLFVLML